MPWVIFRNPIILSSWVQRQRSPSTHLVRSRVQRLVRIFILAARLFHSHLQIVFSSAESGRISGQADLHIFYPNVCVEAEARFGADSLQRLVRGIISLLWCKGGPCGFTRSWRDASNGFKTSHIFIAWSSRHPFSVTRHHSYIIPPRTSAFTLGAPCAP